MNIFRLFHKPTRQERLQVRIYEAARKADNLLILSGRLENLTGQTRHEVFRYVMLEAKDKGVTPEEILLERLETFTQKPD